ncbi:MAG TPA: DUF2207 domain-containing protein [Actinomycetota bacterium]|nr:DUF2207 domain-containing protein [Actinomycetota bacterium]
MRRVIAVLIVATGALLATSGIARAQFTEQIDGYDVAIELRTDGSLRITEVIDYDFGVTEHHGIFRDVPTRVHYDDTYDRVYPLTVESVSATGGASADYTTERDGSLTRIKIGDPEETVSGDHRYTIVYTVEGATNGFSDHDELYWNAIGDEWPVSIDDVTVQVEAPGDITDSLCFQGPERSTLPCDGQKVRGAGATFRQQHLDPYSGVTIVLAFPKGVLDAPAAILEERWSVSSAFRLTPVTGGVSGALLLLIVGGAAVTLWRTGRDRRYQGSPIDQVMGNPTGDDEAVPIFDADSEAPVEFAPPGDMRPGQMGTLVDEQANTLDVSATIVDLAVRGFLMIQEIPNEGWFGKPDWTLIKLEESEAGLLTYERRLLNALFRDGSEVTISDLRNTFAARLEGVEESLYVDVVNRGWFRSRPDKVRSTWQARGVVALILGAALTFVLARWTHWGLVGIPLILGGLLLVIFAKRMPARTASGTAMLRRVRGFRRVIETAETHMSQWAEKEMIFTTFLPYAVVFGCTDKWAKAFAALGVQPDTSWYVSPRPFVYTEFAQSMDGFAVTTGGTIASTPSGSGSSGFGGGGFSGGGGGGGGGGSW